MLWGAEKETGRFQAGPASSYPGRQTTQNVTVAARAFETEEQIKPAFGKLNPYRYGVLPVLVVIENKGSQTLSLANIRAEYQAPDRRRVEATPPGDVRYLGGGKRPGVVVGSPLPTGSPRVSRSKNPLNSDVIDARAFGARMLPPGESASGFFYFQTGYQRGSQLYVAGIQEAKTGRDLFYFEIPLQTSSQ